MAPVSVAPASAAGPARHSTVPDRARCLSRAQVNRVRNHLDYAPRLYRACEGWVQKVMRRARLRPDRNTTRGVLAMALAHRFASYGTDSGSTYEALAFQPHLECSGYMMLTDFIYKAMGGDMSRDVLQGWDGGAVGNHAQLWVGGVLLDPTVGVAAEIKLSSIRQGHPTDRLLDLHHFRVPTGQEPPPPTDFTDIVWGAIRDGLYRPEDELYTVRSVDELRHWSAPPVGQA